MTNPRFMSELHVEMMNRILDADADSKAACSMLDRSYWMCYELVRGGETVWWSVEFNPQHGVRFSLRPPADADPDILYRGNYLAVVEAIRRSKANQNVTIPTTTCSDPDVMAIIGPAFDAAGRCATIPTEFTTD